MKLKLLFISLVFTAAPTFAQSDAPPERSYLGVMLDSNPIPVWLGQHLHLQPNQGIRVRNMHSGGPADRAGLQQDDIIIELNGTPILDRRDFITAIANTGVDRQISLTIMREGERSEVVATLGQAPEQYQPKYPPEPQEIQSWRQVNGLRYDAEQKKWKQVTLPQAYDDVPNELYQMRYNGGENPIVIIISGSPQDDQSKIEVRQGENRYQTTVKDIGSLPEPLLNHAQQALNEARRKKRQDSRDKIINEHTEALRQFWQEHRPEDWEEHTNKILKNIKDYTEQLDQAAGKPRLMLEDQRERLERLEKQIQEVLERLQALEDRAQETVD